MRKLLLLPVLAIAFANCSDSLVTAPEDTSTAPLGLNAKQGTKFVPFKAIAEGFYAFDENANGFCETVPVEGNGTQLGHFTGVMVRCPLVMVANTNGADFYFYGWFAFEAANGDILCGEYPHGEQTGLEAFAYFDFVDEVGPFNLIVQPEFSCDGTGRFDVVDGGGLWYAVAEETATGIFLDFEFEGAISSVGTSK